jgi:hypothetical protein
LVSSSGQAAPPLSPHATRIRGRLIAGGSETGTKSRRIESKAILRDMPRRPIGAACHFQGLPLVYFGVAAFTGFLRGYVCEKESNAPKLNDHCQSNLA